MGSCDVKIVVGTVVNATVVMTKTHSLDVEKNCSTGTNRLWTSVWLLMMMVVVMMSIEIGRSVFVLLGLMEKKISPSCYCICVKPISNQNSSRMHISARLNGLWSMSMWCVRWIIPSVEVRGR